MSKESVRDVWPRRGAWLIVALLALSLCVQLADVWRVTNHHDLAVFLRAANRLAADEDIYADAAPFQAAIESGSFSLRDDSVVWPYAYSPLIAILFLPMRGLSLETVGVGWWIANNLMLLGGCWLALRSVAYATPGRVALVFLMLHGYAPAVSALRLGQIEILQFLLLAVTLWGLRRDREVLAGLALGLATGLKFFPGALIVWLLWRRRWRPALWAIGSAVLLTVGSFALVGWDAFTRYLSFSSMYGIGGAYAAFPLNHSLNGLFSRNLMANVFSASLKGWDLPALAKGLTLAADLMIVAVCAALTGRGWSRKGAATPQDAWRDPLEFALATSALLLVSPHSQVYGFVWALLPLIVWTMARYADDATRWWHWGLALLAYLLVGRDYELFVPGITRLVQAHFTLGALLLWGLVGGGLWASVKGYWRG